MTQQELLTFAAVVLGGITAFVIWAAIVQWRER